MIVVETIFPVMPETSTFTKKTSHMDVFMMSQIRGGKERSQQEFLAPGTASGFSGIKFECSVCNYWVMEFFK